jgi:dTDP-4-amino-4,6-dideoxygalactose transaminase
MRLPKGSEVICSAVTIKDMIKVVQLHGLVPVAVDLHADTLEPRVDLLKQAINPGKTKLIVVAHIFGVIAPLDGLCDVANEHGIPVVEDCAEAFVGPSYMGHPGATAVTFSFGTIKTTTALGGSVWIVRNGELLQEMRRLNGQFTPRSNVFFLKRLIKYMGVSALMAPHVWGVAVRAINGVGLSWEEVITSVSRGFPGPDLIGQLRQRPSIPLLALMEHRFKHYSGESVTRRKRLSEQLAARLEGCEGITVPGLNAKFHSYWLFPVMVHPPLEPRRVCSTMLKLGYDVTSGTTQLGSVDDYVFDKTDRFLSLEPKTASSMMKSIIYLPVTQDMPEDTMLAMADMFIKVIRKMTGKSARGGVGSARTKSTRTAESSGGGGKDLVLNDDEDYLIPVTHVARM